MPACASDDELLFRVRDPTRQVAVGALVKHPCRHPRGTVEHGARKWLKRWVRKNRRYLDILINISIFPVNRSAVAAVQRVSKTIFVVKCIPSAKFPIGYLHSSFIEVRSKSGATERKFICPCRKVKNYTGADMTGKECSHFYACILAFISDEKLMNEFSYHIQVPRSTLID